MKKALLLNVILFLWVSGSYAGTYYVNKYATGNGSGNNWTNAFTTIEEAFKVTVAGDQVWVAAGVYKPLGTAYAIPNGIKIYGGFAGTETALSQRDLKVSTTTLDGDIGVAGVKEDNCTFVVTIADTSGQTLFDGFKIINAFNVTSESGGAIKVSGSATIQNCEFTANQAANGACIGFSGAGVLNVLHCSLNKNNAVNGSGIYAGGGTLYLKDSMIKSNRASANGGAIYSLATVIIDRCDISGNFANNSGGAFYSDNAATYEIYNSIIVGNYAANYAVMYMALLNVNIHKIINCTISGNRCQDESKSGALIALNVDRNSQFYNNIVWSNIALAQVVGGTIDKCFIMGSIPYNYSVIEISRADPGLINAAVPGDVPFTTDGYNYHLAASSPAINYGSNSYVSPSCNYDLEGNARVYGTAADAGAFESQILSADGFQDAKIAYFYHAGSKSLVFVKNASLLLDKEVDIYDFSGRLVAKNKITSDTMPLNLQANAYYIAKVEGAGSLKFFVK